MPLALALCCGRACILHAPSVLSSGHSEQGGPCPRGHFCPGGTSLPRPCPAGSYNNLTGQASCFPCPAGYYCPETVTTYSGHPCPAGFYCPRGECPGCGPREQGWQWGRPWRSELSRRGRASCSANRHGSWGAHRCPLLPRCSQSPVPKAQGGDRASPRGRAQSTWPHYQVSYNSFVLSSNSREREFLFHNVSTRAKK